MASIKNCMIFLAVLMITACNIQAVLRSGLGEKNNYEPKSSDDDKTRTRLSKEEKKAMLGIVRQNAWASRLKGGIISPPPSGAQDPI